MTINCKEKLTYSYYYYDPNSNKCEEQKIEQYLYTIKRRAIPIYISEVR